MKATIENIQNKHFQHNKNINSYRREKHFLGAYNVIVENQKGELQDLINCRVYDSQAKTSVCVWVTDNSKNLYIGTVGASSGYGYHRSSSALDEALRLANIKLDQDIEGRGEEAMVQALEAIAKELGYNKILTVKSFA